MSSNYQPDYVFPEEEKPNVKRVKPVVRSKSYSKIVSDCCGVRVIPSVVHEGDDEEGMIRELVCPRCGKFCDINEIPV